MVYNYDLGFVSGVEQFMFDNCYYNLSRNCDLYLEKFRLNKRFREGAIEGYELMNSICCHKIFEDFDPLYEDERTAQTIFQNPENRNKYYLMGYRQSFYTYHTHLLKKWVINEGVKGLTTSLYLYKEWRTDRVREKASKTCREGFDLGLNNIDHIVKKSADISLNEEDCQKVKMWIINLYKNGNIECR